METVYSVVPVVEIDDKTVKLNEGTKRDYCPEECTFQLAGSCAFCLEDGFLSVAGVILDLGLHDDAPEDKRPGSKEIKCPVGIEFTADRISIPVRNYPEVRIFC
ncbi:MAG: hypothetical protein UZ20_WS6002001118 [candidate division WS6 bacterium OLB21]|uniref:Uncharacterized protein n=1 Tax=candidate division WS6 bacterium OLB21 TaxID=1617427 RepID=A0A136KEP5_9BACT|nr:MAG: hypothetical protein UZ20_WS6002001118 [candidate division WS6 bacterium OLB21]